MMRPVVAAEAMPVKPEPSPTKCVALMVPETSSSVVGPAGRPILSFVLAGFIVSSAVEEVPMVPSKNVPSASVTFLAKVVASPPPAYLSQSASLVVVTILASARSKHRAKQELISFLSKRYQSRNRLPSSAAGVIEIVSGNCLRETGVFPGKFGDFLMRASSVEPLQRRGLGYAAQCYRFSRSPASTPSAFASLPSMVTEAL